MSSRSRIITLLFGLSSFTFAYSQTDPLTVSQDTSPPLAPRAIQLVENVSGVLGAPPEASRVGSISGRIFFSGAQELSGIDGVKLVLRSVPSTALFVREQVSDETGSFAFEQLAPGDYALTVESGTVPEKFRVNSIDPIDLKVDAENETKCNIPVAARRTIRGVVFVDRNNDKVYTPGKDEVVAGALVSAQGMLAVTDATGSYSLEALSSGRLALLVQSSRKGSNAAVHVVLDLGPSADRVVNIPIRP